MEVTINPKASVPIIIGFDGHVLELFIENGPGARYHVRHLSSVTLGPDKKGRQQLAIAKKWGLPTQLEVAPEQVAEVQALVAAVRQAMTA